MRNIIKFSLAFFVGAFLFYFIVKETGIETVLDAIGLFFGIKGVILLLVTLLIVFVGALRWRLILLSDDEDVPIILVIRYLIKGFTIDFLTPFSLFGGEAVKVFLMEKRVGVRSAAFSSITDKIVDVTVHVFFLLTGISLFLFYATDLNKGVLFYAGAVIIVVLSVLALFYWKMAQKKSFLKWIFEVFGVSKKILEKTDNGKIVADVEQKIIDFFSIKKRFFFKAILLSMIRHLLLALRVFLVLFFITSTPQLLVSLMIYGLIILSMMLPIPAAIGGMEAILALGFSALGLPLGMGVVIAIAVRSADLVVCGVGFLLFLKMSFSTFLGQFRIFLKSFGG